MLSTSHTSDLDTLRIAFGALAWYKKIFFPLKLRQILTSNTLPSLSTEGPSTCYKIDIATTLIQTFLNSWHFLKHQFKCLRAFECSNIVSFYQQNNTLHPALSDDIVHAKPEQTSTQSANTAVSTYYEEKTKASTITSQNTGIRPTPQNELSPNHFPKPNENKMTIHHHSPPEQNRSQTPEIVEDPYKKYADPNRFSPPVI